MQKKSSLNKTEKTTQVCHTVIRFIIFCCLVFITAAGVALFKAPSLLRLHDMPKRSDAIVVLGGNPLRSFHAGRLYKAGFAPVVYINKPKLSPGDELIRDAGVSWISEEELSRRILLRQGVAERDIRVYGPTQSTVEEADYIAKLFAKRPCTLLIVTSPYHARRASMIFRDKLSDFCEVTVIGTPDEPFPDAWWANQDAARHVLLETVKIIFYQLGGRYYSAGT
jgi:uncharacterized SAM-binding protein YcdF (DUF218 family)